MSLSLGSQFSPKNLVKLAIAVILTAFVAIAVLPNYWSGQWPWLHPPGVAQIENLREIRASGLALPEWQIDYHEEVAFGGNKWSVQQLTPEPPGANAATDSDGAFLLLLKPQGQAQDQPEVEWLDLKGAQHWTMDRRQRLRLQAASTASESEQFEIQANFLRVWNSQQTYAALQWYAWPGGGHPTPSHWFWQDQKAQWLHRQRLPWVAVNLLVPIEPLGEVGPHQDAIEQLGQAVQRALQVNVFKSSSLTSS